VYLPLTTFALAVIISAAWASTPAQSNWAELLNEHQRAIEQLKLEVEKLKADNDRLSRTVVALPTTSTSWRGLVPAATSSLEPKRAEQVANAISLLVPYSSVSMVTPTKSMVPVFDANSYVLLEEAPFDDLRVGDIITFSHPTYAHPVVHRIIERRGDKLWTKGDSNSGMDKVYVTRENYQRRIFGIVYGRPEERPRP
jgi:hypothetical protein